MDEQKDYPRLQMNPDLKNATVHIQLDAEARREAYRLTNRLLQFSFESEPKRRVAEALCYKDAEQMRAGVEALTQMIIQTQYAFGEAVPTKVFDPDLDNAPAKDCGLDQGGQEIEFPALANDVKQRFELTTDDKSQLAELNSALKRHCISWRELAIIVKSLRVRPEFTLDDFPFGYNRTNLYGYATEELVTELGKRDGVESFDLEPYASVTMKLEGPATVLKVLV